MLAAGNYPQSPVTGQILSTFPPADGIEIDYANVAGQPRHFTGTGGRILIVLAESDSLQQAHDRVYHYLADHRSPHCFYRHDIGAKAGLE